MGQPSERAEAEGLAEVPSEKMEKIVNEMVKALLGS